MPILGNNYPKETTPELNLRLTLLKCAFFVKEKKIAELFIYKASTKFYTVSFSELSVFNNSKLNKCFICV